MAKVTIEDVCRSAWESTRSESAVPYDQLIDSYRAKLTERAEAVLNGEWPAGAWQAFETEVCALADGRGKMQVGSEIPETPEPVAAPAVAEEEVDDGEEAEPTSQAEKEHLDLKGPLPEDFPSKAKLHDAGINTYGQLNKVEDLTTIDGIGPKLAKAIHKRLKADSKTLNK